MALPNELHPLQLGASSGGYEIEQSLRFDGFSYLHRTPTAYGGGRIFTHSAWVKKVDNGGYETLITAYNGSNADDTIRFDASDKFKFFLNDTSDGNVDTLAVYKDPSAWYHVVTAVNISTQTVKQYVNGVDVTGSVSIPSGQFVSSFNQSGKQNAIGRRLAANNYYFDGYMAEVYWIDNQFLDQYDFGEFDDNGVWRPIEYTGTYGTNGCLLKFDPTAANGIGHDYSGNGNHWTPVGFTTSGTGTDVMSDTPTNNYCTLNPLTLSASGAPILSEGNLVQVTPNVGGGNGYGTMAIPSSGKWYWEVHVDANSGGAIIGIAEYNPNEDYAWQLGNSAMYYFTGQKFIDGTATSYGSGFAADDLIGVACDADAGTIQFYKEGTAQGSISHAVSGLFPCLTDGSSAGGCTYTINFGQRAFEQTVPTGYKALNTKNLPAPTVKDGSDYFNTVLYAGSGGSSSITGVGFQPDFTWIKGRTGENHTLVDAVRGAPAFLISNSTYQEQSYAGKGLTSFDSDGFTVYDELTGGYAVNKPGATYVAWNWLAGNGTSSIAAGSVDGTNPTIASTVSANPSAGFSIVTYTGDLTAAGNSTIGHGLGVAPSFIITKDRDNSTPWIIQHTSLGDNQYLKFDTTSVANSSSIGGGDLPKPTSTVFYGSWLSGLNTNGNDHVAYCFAEVEGYSKFGTYVGSSNYPFVYCGFKPAWLLMKNTATANWLLLDVARGQYYNPIGYKNSTKESLYANSAVAESATGSGFEVDFLSNGFNCRASVPGELNEFGSTYIFAAFAENPFGGSGVSPATAR